METAVHIFYTSTKEYKVHGNNNLCLPFGFLCNICIASTAWKQKTSVSVSSLHAPQSVYNSPSLLYET